ncbi:DMT family transporter [Chitinimonas lacunae]|uniref:DMT family transporter n=1 Tax=Chitinimonas lacunae TaxID=1963018 RepID=A0ABV8MUE3_9NEIS
MLGALSLIARPMTSQRLHGALLILLSSACFGVMPLFGRLAYDAGANTQAILLGRFLIAATGLAALMGWRRTTWPRGRLLLGLLAMGMLGYAGQAFCYFTALRYASASLTALLLYTYPVLVTLIAAFWLNERLTRRKIVSLLLATLGLGLTVGDALSGSWQGVAFGLTAALIYSIYIAVGSRLTPQAGAVASAAVVMAGGALMFALAAPFSPPIWPSGLSGWLAVAAIGLLCSVVAALTFFAGLSRVGAGEAAMLSTFEPVVTVALAAALLGERMSPTQWLGGAVIIAAVLLLARAPGPTLPE